MQITIIPKAEAPARGPLRPKQRSPEAEALVDGLAPGQVARIELGDGEKPRPITEHLYRAATRRGKLIDIWEVGGIFYAELVATDATPEAGGS